MKRFLNILKAAIISVIVVFCFVVIISFTTYKVCSADYKVATDLIDIVTEKTFGTEMIEPVLENNKLENYPTIGTKYATLKIQSIGVELPVYFGQSYTLLKSGIGHDTASHFPGEGGSIIYMGHNFYTFLAKLPEAKKGDLIELETTYGTFEYTIYDTAIVNETEVDKVPIQEEKEILMIYTCYPINNLGHAYQRYVVYAEPKTY